MLWAPILQFTTSCQLIYGPVVNFLSHLSNIYWNILFLTDKVLYKTSVKTQANSIKYLLLPNLLLWFSPASRLQNKLCYAQSLSKFSEAKKGIPLKLKLIWKEWKIPIYFPGEGWPTQWFLIFSSLMALLLVFPSQTLKFARFSWETNFIYLVVTRLLLIQRCIHH